MKLVFIFIVALATNSAAATEEPQQMALRHRTLCASKGSKGKSKGTGRMKKAGCDRKQSYSSYDGDDNDYYYYYYASRAAMSMSMNVALEDEEFFGENDGFSIYYNEGNAHDMMSKGKDKGNHNSSRSHSKGRASDGASEKSKSSKGTEGSFRPSKGAYRSSSGDKEPSDGSKGIGRGYYSDATSRSFGKGEFRYFASKGIPVGKGSGGSGGSSSSKGSGGSYYSAKNGEKSFSSRSSKGSYSGRSQEGPWKGNYYSVKKSYNSYQGGFQEREGSEEVPSNDHD